LLYFWSARYFKTALQQYKLRAAGPAPEGLVCITNGCAVDQPDESQHAPLQPIILACLGNDC
jgi:hypothetical protein